MKVYKKELKSITLNNGHFKYVVIENPDKIIFRAFSYKFKDTFCEIHISWKQNYFFNPYLPSVAKLMIEYAIENGWNYSSNNHVLKLKLDNNGDTKHFLQQLYTDADLELAYRIYPNPTGTLYYKKDLCNEKDVEILFDYCSILEAIIYKQGWKFLIIKYGYSKLYEINKRSEWLSTDNIEDFIDDIEINMEYSN